MTLPSRPPPRKSGRAPRRDVVVTSAPDETAEAPELALTRDTIAALQSRALELASESQRQGRSRAQRLSRTASDLEQAIILRAPQIEIERLCVECAALALRIRQAGD